MPPTSCTSSAVSCSAFLTALCAARAGIETKNIITGNLIANTRESFAMLTTDATPASYWLVNGDNYVERNIAAGRRDACFSSLTLTPVCCSRHAHVIIE